MVDSSNTHTSQFQNFLHGYTYQSESESHLVLSDSLRPHGLYSPLNSPGQNTGVGSHPFSRGLPNQGIEPRFPTLQGDSLPGGPPGKPKNTGVGSPSLLQQIFPTQESNQGLLCCRCILLPAELPGVLAWRYTHRSMIELNLEIKLYIYDQLIFNKLPGQFNGVGRRGRE